MSDQSATITRDRILDVAEDLFATHGFAGTSMRDIAQRADLTAPSLYNHFDGKEALYEAVLQRGILPLAKMVQSLEARETGPDVVEDIVREVMAHLAQRPNLPRLIHYEAISGGTFLTKMAREWVRPLLERAAREFKRTSENRFSEEELPNVVAAWAHLVLGHFALAPLFREVWEVDPLSPEQIGRHADFLRKLALLLHSQPAD